MGCEQQEGKCCRGIYTAVYAAMHYGIGVHRHSIIFRNEKPDAGSGENSRRGDYKQTEVPLQTWKQVSKLETSCYVMIDLIHVHLVFVNPDF